MKRLINLIFCFLFLAVAANLHAQNLTGIWRGTFYNPTEIAMGGSKYRYEVQIDNKGRETKGVTYSYQTTRFYGKASLVGVWSTSTKNLVLQETEMLDLKITGGGDGCLMTCYLTYKKEDGKEYLEGTYSSYNMNNKNQNCGGGRVFLEKVPDTDFELEDFLKDKAPEKSSGKVKPGQEDFLVKSPATGTPPPAPKATPPAAKPPVKKPAPTGAKPPASGSKPPATAPKTSSSGAKPPAAAPKPAPQATAGAKPPAAKPPATVSSGTKPPAPKTATTGKPATKPPATGSKPATTSTAGTKPPATVTKPVPAAPAPKLAETKKDTGKIVNKNTEPVKPSVVPVAPPPPVLKERKNELFKTITTNKRVIEVSFYDNGEIDGDTISVYNNNRLIASKKGLSSKPVVIKVELSDDNPEQDVVMVAENLGRIPPNTALMIVNAGDQRFTVYLNSSEQKNAMVRFRYEP